jgi:hypothetical protein
MSTFMQRTYLSHQESFFMFALISTRLEGINALLALSWDFSDSSHGDGLTEGLNDVRRWIRLEIV